MNLFWSTRMLTEEKEDHLTEFLAAALHASENFRTAYAKHVLTDYAKARNWDAPEIESVKTQVRFPETEYCPAMVITLTDGKTIICEHKFDAPVTMASEQEQRARLKQYLNLSVDGLIYFRITRKPPCSDVIKHEKYIYPDNREHFLWEDLYPLLVEAF